MLLQVNDSGSWRNVIHTDCMTGDISRADLDEHIDRLEAALNAVKVNAEGREGALGRGLTGEPT